MKKALVILSGGQDSTTCLFWAKQQGYEVHAITFDYGQTHSIELESAFQVGTLAEVKSHEFVRIPDILKSTSPLTNKAEMLEKYENAEQMDAVIGNRVEKTFVPMRNTLFFTIAMNRAVAIGCFDLVTGICQADNANYPDCTEDFRHLFEKMANESLGTHYGHEDSDFKIHAPLMYMSKAQSVLLAHKLPGAWDALAYTHTSYDGKYPPTDNNHSNLLRAEGFEKANLPDPLVLRAAMEGLMVLPGTDNYNSTVNRSSEKDREIMCCHTLKNSTPEKVAYMQNLLAEMKGKI